MNDDDLDPELPARAKEYQDPHYHDDDDLDIERDEDVPHPDRPPVCEKVVRRPPLEPRRYIED